MNQVLILHGAILNATLRTREAIRTMTIFPNPLHSPDLPTSNFHLFVPLMDALRGCCFVDNDDLQHSLFEELQHFSEQFYVTSIQHPMQQSKMCVVDEEDFVEK